MSLIMSVAAASNRNCGGTEFTKRRKPETGQRDRKPTAYANDVGKTMPPQTGAQPEQQPALNATGKVTFRLFVCLSWWRS